LLIALILLIALFAVLVWPTKYKYLPYESDYLAIRINRFTGESEGLHPNLGWKKFKEKKESISLLSPLPLLSFDDVQMSSVPNIIDINEINERLASFEKELESKLPPKLGPKGMKKINSTYRLEPINYGNKSISEYFIVTLYNGSDSKLGYIVITIQIIENNGNIRWSKSFSGDINVDSCRSGTFGVEIPKVNKEKISWTIDEIRKFQERHP
jgi:hypothetical protein